MRLSWKYIPIAFLAWSLSAVSWAASTRVYHSTKNHWPVRSAPGSHNPQSRIIDHVTNAQPLTYLSSKKDKDGDVWFRVSYKSGTDTRKAYIYSGLVVPADPSQTDAFVCTGGDCHRPTKESLNSQSGQILDAIEEKGGDTAPGYALPRGKFSPTCSNFINKKGLGSYGRRMVQAMQAVSKSCFYEHIDVKSLCPNYHQLSTAKKNAFWALVFASIAQTESTCRLTHTKARGIYGTADGLFQLEYSYRLRAQSGRSRRWCHTGGPANVETLSFQAECAASTINDTICRKGRPLNTRTGYWQKLRGNRHITTLIRDTARSWKLCR